MQDLSERDLQVIKVLSEASRGLARVQKHTRRVYSDLKSDQTLDKTIIRQAQVQTLSFVKKFAAVKKLQKPALLAKLDPDVQASVVWLASVMDALAVFPGLLAQAKKHSKLDAQKKAAILIRTCTKLRRQHAAQSTAITKMLTAADAAADKKTLQIKHFAFMPMAILLYGVHITLRKHMRAQPRLPQ